MKVFRSTGAIAVLGLAASALAGQEYTVKIVDRQDNSSGYTYVVPGYSTTNSTANANCSAYSNSAYCNGAATTTTTGTSSYVGSYQVQGATLSLQLPDLRVAVVNCNSKVNWSDWSQGAYRSCRIPMVNTIQAEFDGDKAKLKWSVSIDGKKMQSETYKVVAVLQPSADAIKEAQATAITSAFTARHPDATAEDLKEVIELAASSKVSIDPNSTWEQYADKLFENLRMIRVERAFRARHPELTPTLETELVALGNSGQVRPQAGETPDAFLERLYAQVLAGHPN